MTPPLNLNIVARREAALRGAFIEPLLALMRADPGLADTSVPWAPYRAWVPPAVLDEGHAVTLHVWVYSCVGPMGNPHRMEVRASFAWEDEAPACTGLELHYLDFALLQGPGGVAGADGLVRLPGLAPLRAVRAGPTYAVTPASPGAAPDWPGAVHAMLAHIMPRHGNFAEQVQEHRRRHGW